MIWAVVGRLLAALVKPLTYLFGALWLRNDAVKDAQAKADAKAQERMNDADTGRDLTDDERVKRLHDIAKRLGG